MSERLISLSKPLRKPNPPGTVGAVQTLDILRSLGCCGVDPEALCRAAALDPQRLERDAEKRVAPRIVADVFAAAERASGDPLIGLHAAAHATPRGPLLFLMLAEANLAASLRAWERYAPIPISSLRVHVELDAHTAAMIFDLGEPTLEQVPHVVEYLLLAVLRALVMASAGDLRPLRIDLRHPAHGDLAEAQCIVRCPVRFDGGRHAIVFRRDDLDTPSRLANPVIAAQIAAEAAAAARQATVHATWRDRVADVTRALLVTGERADRASVARQLHTSEPTLHRVLRDEGTTFKAVRDSEVWNVARMLLANPQIKIEAVALTVGFADGASFAKAFKRHAGLSPRAFRDSVAHAAPRRTVLPS
ncbi:AraC family transcriptional regulator [Candidatus Binatia bacterium]|jgi:AraC-like DNA-binding protein|nr:AraC family transcriptional regulator [Candidatus Binatia bacterium]